MTNIQNFKEIPNREFEEHLLKRSQRPTSNRDKVTKPKRNGENGPPPSQTSQVDSRKRLLIHMNSILPNL